MAGECPVPIGAELLGKFHCGLLPLFWIGRVRRKTPAPVMSDEGGQETVDIVFVAAIHDQIRRQFTASGLIVGEIANWIALDSSGT